MRPQKFINVDKPLKINNNNVGQCPQLEVCVGMGKTGIPWDSHGNGSKISHGMGMGIKCMGMGVKTWELSPATVNSLV